MKPFYEHPDGITLYAGDCIDVMRQLPENSVDAVVTDPPYGLEFMGEDWDAPWKQGGDVVADAEEEGGFQDGAGGKPFSRSRIRYGHKSSSSHAEARTKRADELDDPSKGRYIRAGVNAYEAGVYSQAKAGMPGGSFSAVNTPSHFGGLNPKCQNCGKWQRGGNPCSCEKPDFPNERRIRGSMFEDWCYDWAVEALRVLKPGGYLLAFGGSRTWHRLACAIEDAGFEIRDSLAFIHVQGFPKSRDVTEAMTKYLAEGPTKADLADLRAVTTFLREARDAAGWTNAQIDALFGTNGMGGHWTTAGSQPRCPSIDEWEILRDALGFDDSEILPIVQRIAAENRPEGWGEGGNQRFLGALEYDDEAPPAGRYGSAMKPAWEPVMRAQKPHPIPRGLLERVNTEMGELLWQSLSPAKRAELSSAFDHRTLRDAAIAVASAATESSTGEFAATATFNSPETASMFSSIASSWSSIWDASSDPTRTFTTSTRSSTITGLRILSSLLAPITSEITTPPSETPMPDGSSPAANAETCSSASSASSSSTPSASAAASVIAGIGAAVWSALAEIVEGLSIAQEVDSSADGNATRAGEPVINNPIVMARKPLIGSIANNIAAYGVGCLDIDAGRIPTNDKLGGGANTGMRREGRHKGWARPWMDDDKKREAATERSRRNTEHANATGRWPANVVLDEVAAAEAEIQSPGSSRCFLVTPKAPQSERPKYYRQNCTCEDTWPTPITSTPRATAGTAAQESSSTSKSGSATTDAQSQTGTRSTTSTGTSSTTTRATSSPSLPPSTNASTAAASSSTASGGSPAASVTSSSPSTSSTGTSAKKAGRSTDDAVDATSTKCWSEGDACAKCGTPARRLEHATVKSLKLMRWLIRMVTPSGGTVLEPFSGSGTTAEACLLERRSCIAIEKSSDYLPLTVARLEREHQHGFDLEWRTS